MWMSFSHGIAEVLSTGFLVPTAVEAHEEAELIADGVKPRPAALQAFQQFDTSPVHIPVYGQY